MKPLADVRIIAIEQYGAGPFGSLHLADLGAEVIKIEDPSSGGDVSRYVPPQAHGKDSIFFETFNRNKRSIMLDMASPEGRAVFEDLVQESDAVYSNLRGDVPAKMRIRYEDLKHINPAIVCVSLSGFGMTGPRATEPGYDYLLQGLAGWMSVTGDPVGPPSKSGLSMVDYSGGFVAAISLLAGVHAARRDGVGGDSDVSLFDTAVTLLNYLATWSLNGDFVPQRMANSAHPSLVPFQNFEVADGWIVIACAKEKFWKRLAAAIGRPELAEDDRYMTFSDRRENSQELIKILEGTLLAHSSEYWISKLSEAGVPVGPILDVEQTLKDPHTIARGLIVETDHPRFGRVRQLASPVNFGDVPPEYRRAPTLNEDFEYVLSKILKYSPDRVSQLGRLPGFSADQGAEPVHTHSNSESAL
jgi:crotonobetainyl-CoA:carnitine CoA-transferase CaiB-like acyl-CoA transferase